MTLLQMSSGGLFQLESEMNFNMHVLPRSELCNKQAQYETLKALKGHFDPGLLCKTKLQGGGEPNMV